MKTYVGIALDRSASITQLRLNEQAKRDFNTIIESLRSSAGEIDTIVTIVAFGGRARAEVNKELLFSSLQAVRPIDVYNADGYDTPLYDAISTLIEIMEKAPDADREDVSFMVMAVTDGRENSSGTMASMLNKKIREKTNTGRWTFVVRLPPESDRTLRRELTEIPAGNIQTWETTSKGFAAATTETAQAITRYYQDRRNGTRATTSFFSNLDPKAAKKIEKKLEDVTKDVKFFVVNNVEEGKSIQDFVEKRTKKPYVKGNAFYQLMKTEDKVQDYKEIAVRHKQTKQVYSGAAARDLLGLPHVGDIRLKPGNHGDYDVFIQSTSTNRILPVGSYVMVKKQ